MVHAPATDVKAALVDTPSHKVVLDAAAPVTNPKTIHLEIPSSSSDKVVSEKTAPPTSKISTDYKDTGNCSQQ